MTGDGIVPDADIAWKEKCGSNASVNGKVRRRQFWIAIHRYLGLATLAFLAMAAGTGVILSFHKPLDAILNPDLFLARSPVPIEPRIAVKAYAARHPDLQVASFPLAVAPGRTLGVTVAAQPGAGPLAYDQVFIDRNDGHVAGTRQSGAGWDRRHVMQGIFDLHYTLLAGTFGRWLMGVIAVAWLVGNLVGLYLTFPLNGRFWRMWKKAWFFRWTYPSTRLWHDLHRASGLWVLVGITVLAFTSISMNFFDEVFTPAVQAASPFRPSPFDGPARIPHVPRIDPVAAAAAATAAAGSYGIAWRPAKVSYDRDYDVYRVLFTDDGFENYRGLGPQSLFVDGHTGRIVHFDDPYTDSAGRKLSRALYPLHTGQAAGAAGIAVVILLGLATIEMCLSGGYVWWKRRRGRIVGDRARRTRMGRAVRTHSDEGAAA